MDAGAERPYIRRMPSLAPLLSELHGHAYTIGPRLWYGRRLKVPAVEPWTTSLSEGERDIAISGLYSRQPAADTLVIVMHGCGGTPHSHYIALCARHFYEAGYSVLRLAWRGADMRGEDFYHAAQTADVHAALEHAAFARYQHVWLIGYSLGGHCVMHVAHETREPRVRGVVAVCPVLHLAQANLAIDSQKRAWYRRYVLGGLIAGYEQHATRGLGPAPIEQVKLADTFRKYDALTVVPRYGFESVDDYYERACVSRVVDRIELPTLIVAARHDPMLPWQIADSVRPRLSPAVSFRWAERGGHTGFPRDLDLGEPGALGLESQVETWLKRQREQRC
jgi:predicted alpha/beta-fold hydrolase